MTYPLTIAGPIKSEFDLSVDGHSLVSGIESCGDQGAVAMRLGNPLHNEVVTVNAPGKTIYSSNLEGKHEKKLGKDKAELSMRTMQVQQIVLRQPALNGLFVLIFRGFRTHSLLIHLFRDFPCRDTGLALNYYCLISNYYGGAMETEATFSRDIPPREAAVIAVMRTADMLTRVGDTLVFDDDLSQAQFNIMMILKYSDPDGISQKEILQHLVSTKGNLSIHIRNLADMNYVTKKTSPHDGRRNVIALTAVGQHILDAVEPAYLKQLKLITAHMTLSNAEALTEQLGKLVAHCSTVLNGKEGDSTNDL